jgi:hypothetical protein
MCVSDLEDQKCAQCVLGMAKRALTYEHHSIYMSPKTTRRYVQVAQILHTHRRSAPLVGWYTVPVMSINVV